MGGPFLELEWLARRRDGESAALIAWRDGATENVVRRVTDPFGPFPPATRQLGRTHTPAGALTERAAWWVRARRQGQTAAAVAREAGVSAGWVRRLTAGHGPYPDPQLVQTWVTARRQGTAVALVATTWQVPAALVRRTTGPFGPFPHGTVRRLPAGVLGVKALAARTGISYPSLLRWEREGMLPAPDVVTGAGRRLWLEQTVQEWLRSADLVTCPTCGARCVSLRHHTAGAHRAEERPR